VRVVGSAMSLGYACLCLTACNAMLGIHAPEAIVPDASTPALPSVTDAGEPMVTVDAAGSGDPELWAAWPMPNPSTGSLDNPASYEAASPGVVRDKVTRLSWQDPIDDTLRTRGAASAYCASLALDGGGFRVPTRIELLSLIDFTRSSPAIDTDAFPGAPAELFWSSSTLAGDPSAGWVINFGPGNGFVSSSDIATKYRVRCVR
jgi:hypothetical protein